MRMNLREFSTGIFILLFINVSRADRWSRQISQAPNGRLDDWIPVSTQLTQNQPLAAAASTIETIAIPQQNDRSSNARVLTYPNYVASASNNAPSTFNFVHPYQFPRFQQQKASPQLLHQPPTSQSFFKFEMPSFGADGHRDNSAPIQTGYQIQHTFGPAPNAVLTQPLFSQKPVFPPEFHPIPQHQHQQHLIQPQRHKQPVPKIFNEEQTTAKDSKPAAQQNFISQQNGFQYQKPTSFQTQFPQNQYRPQALPSPQQSQLHSAPVEDEVQLLYVPYDTLFNSQNPSHESVQQLGFNNPKYNLIQEPVNPLQINHFYTQDPLEQNQQEHRFKSPLTTTSTSTTTSRPGPSTFRPETNYNQFLNPKFTAQKSEQKTKPKPHQPPLAMFFHKSPNYATPSDVVNVLSSERSIAVLDAPSKRTPEVFIGPSGLQSPNGYTKFELPYLSNFDHTSLDLTLKRTPFFVAPLSYKTQPGFLKILLPEPHVGSIVINKPFQTDDFTRSSTKRPVRPSKGSLVRPQANDIQFSNTTPRLTTTTKIQLTPTPANRWQLSNEQPTRVTQTPKDYFYNQYPQEVIKEVSSPKNHQKPTQRQRRPPPTTRPTEPAFTQTVRPYAHFKPMPENVGSDEYFKKPLTTAQTFASSSTTPIPTPSSPTPQTYFTEDFSKNVQSNRAQIFENSTPRPDINHKYQTKPLFNDEYRMKHYFRQQEAHKNRQSSTTPSTVFEKVHYTPVSLDYDQQSSTPNYFDGSTLRTTTPKERFTFYHPTKTASDESVLSNTLPNLELSNNYQVDNQSPEPEVVTIKPAIEHSNQKQESNLPPNHRPTYDNEVTVYDHDDKSQLLTHYDSSPYDVPSEIPPITPNLPGLVNALRENERLNAIEKDLTDPITTTTTFKPTRRPSVRTRRPLLTKTSTSVSYSSSDDNTTRRTINRTRRPHTTRTPTTSSNSTDKIPIRSRNGSRYTPTPEERKQFRIRNRGQSPTSSSKRNKERVQEDNIDYQRDVLKQNYPVFKHPSRKSFFTTEKSDDVITVTPNSLKDPFPGLLEPMQIAQQYQQQIQQDNFGPGYFPNEEDSNPTEPIRNEINPVYNTQSTTISTQTSESSEATEAITKRPPFIRRPRPRTTTTTEVAFTTSEPQRYTVRSRNKSDGAILPRKVIKIRSRTRKPHPASTSTTSEPEIQQATKKENNFQKVSRFNQDFYKDDARGEIPKRTQTRSRFNLVPQESQWSPSLTRKDSFKPMNLKDAQSNIKIENEPDIVTAGPQGGEPSSNQDTYEFNVSAKFGPSMNDYGSVIKQIDKKEVGLRKTEPTFEELLEQVMADIGKEATKKENETTRSISDVSEEVEHKTVAPTKASRKNEKPHRRGVWKKVRVHPAEGFETAESQNIGTQLLNSILTNEKKITTDQIEANSEPLDNVDLSKLTFTTTTTTSTTEKPNSSETTTTMSPEVVVSTETETPKKISTKVETVTSISEEVSRSVITKNPPTTVAPQESSTIPPNAVDSTTTRFYNHDYEHDDTVGEAITKRIDHQTEDEGGDLETQPSLFDEVRSQLKDLFAAEEDDDVDYSDAVKPNFRKHEYSSIQRIRAVTSAPPGEIEKHEDKLEEEKPELTTSNETNFHKNLMKNAVYATSTSVNVDQETEICYRGRCIKAQKQT